MNTLNKITSLLLDQVIVDGVAKGELNDFLTKNNIKICHDYYEFLLKYGNSNFLRQGFFDVEFKEFKRYYLEEETYLGKNLPPNCSYVGSDFTTEPICLDNDDKRIYDFDDNEKGLLYYYGITELLFCCLLNYIDYNQCFDYHQMGIKIDDISSFKNSYFDFEIKHIHAYQRYFFKDNTLVVCSDEFCYYHVYQGGILNELI